VRTVVTDQSALLAHASPSFSGNLQSLHVSLRTVF
jgi:hypothetical protein